MLRRIVRRLLPRREAAAMRMERVEDTTRNVAVRLGELEQVVRHLAEDDLTGSLVLIERRVSQRIGDVEALAGSSVRRAREHAEAAVAAAVSTSVAAAREHTEAAVAAGVRHAQSDAAVAVAAARDAAREHAEAAAQAGADAAIAAAREHCEAAVQAAADLLLRLSREHAESLHHQTLETLHADLASVRRELRTLERVRGRAGASGPPAQAEDVPSSVGVAGTAPPALDPGFYVALEDRFRGDPALISARQTVYLPLIAECVDDEHPLLDLGCGRGEWLRLVAKEGKRAVGVDSNAAFAAEVAEAGAEIVQGDLVEHLRGRSEGSIGAITLFQVVEHLPMPVLLDALTECCRVLRPGGVLIAETPNSTNLRVAASTFWIDPTHERPLHPELLRFIAAHVGFSRVDGWFLNPLGAASGAPADEREWDAWAAGEIRRFGEMVDGPGDFALLAWA